MNRALRQPRMLLPLWTVLLLAPVAWASALGISFALLDETCAQGGHAWLVLVFGLCLLLAILPAPVAWSWRRHFDVRDQAGERTRFMLDVAIGASIVFALTVLLSAVPVFLQSACPP